MEKKVTLSAPWTTFYREVKALFGEDPEIKVMFNEEEGEINLYVNNDTKAGLLSSLLPKTKNFGNVDIAVNVFAPNKEMISDAAKNTWEILFEGNPVFSYVRVIDYIFAQPLTYVIFQNKVVQFFNDNLSDIHGLKSTLYEDIARDVFGEIPGVFFCTDISDNVGNPLGEWP